MASLNRCSAVVFDAYGTMFDVTLPTRERLGARDELAVQVGKICLVSGNGWDIAGAAAFGFSAVWLDRRGEVSERLPGQSIARIASLAELPALFAAAS